MLVFKYYKPDPKHDYYRMVYIVLTPNTYYLTQYERALGKNRKWVRTYVWEVKAMDWEVDVPFVYDFVRKPSF
jgi:hypothetical protein